ncbi:hypothetical protein NM688_g6217 [Phlebia brevispora]|uniref:Uncharacterized protein n=1 Tax=Phlebia brevispora TaxID=194682 RepID=A0ACC1SIL9_9APHY|nr:hypothetical protein NM688_g6217 [Phlebia brevispora]
MSAADPSVVAAYEADLAQYYITLVALTVVCYEYVITLQHEYECYDSALNNFLDVLFEVPMVILAVFSALRVFALLDRAYTIAAIVLLLGLVSFSMDMYQDSHFTPYYYDDPYVIYPNSLTLLHLRYRSSSTSLAGVVATLTADIIAIVITWIKTYRHVREASAIGMHASFTATLLQYGTLYFIVLLLVNIVYLLFLFIPSWTEWVDPTSYLDLLPNIVISRFLINLRELSSSEPGGTMLSSSSSNPSFRTPTLPSIIGNMGERLATGEEVPDDEYEVYGENEDRPAVTLSSGVDEEAHSAPLGDGDGTK